MNHLSSLFPSRRLVLAVATVVACAIGVGVLTGAGGSSAVVAGDPYYENPYYPEPDCVYNNPPTADFTYSPAEPRPGEEVTFTSTATDPDGDALVTGWDFNGDWNPSPGNIDFAHIDRIGPEARWTYDAPGDYRVRMGVQDGCGAGDVIDQTVRVEAAGDGDGGGDGGGGAGDGAAGAGAATQDTSGPTVVVAGVNKTRRVSRRGVFRFVLGPFTEDVTGTIGFVSVDAVVAQRRRRKLRIRTRAISVAQGKRLVIRSKLSRKGRRALLRRKRIRMRARIVLRDSLGNASTRNYAFTLKAPRRKRG